MKILFIHGFNSAGYGNKVEFLKTAFGTENVIAPNLPCEPDKAVLFLEYLVEKLKGPELSIFGTSLGGFYSLYLMNKYNLPCTVINPSLKPYITLKPKLGLLTNFKTQEKYEFKASHLEFFKSMEVPFHELERSRDKLSVYLDQGDEVLDSNETKQYLEGFRVKMFEGGNHRFIHMKELIEDMKSR